MLTAQYINMVDILANRVLFMFMALAMFLSLGIAFATPSVSISPPSNSILSAGQYESFTASVSGGTPPFAFNFIISNSVTGKPVTSMLYTGISSSSFSATIQIPSWTSGFKLEANVVMTDDFGNTISSGSSAIPVIVNVINVSAPGPRPISSPPGPIVFNPSGSSAYIPNVDNVTVISAATNAIVNAISVNNPLGIAFSQSGQLAYVGSAYSGAGHSSALVTVNTTTNAVVNVINLGNLLPSVVAVSPSGTLAYVAGCFTSGDLCLTSGQVSIVNLTTNTVVNAIPFSNVPLALAFNSSGTAAYVATTSFLSQPRISVISTVTNSIVNSISLDATPESIELNPSGTLAYVVVDNNSVAVINTTTNTVVNTIAVDYGSGPNGSPGLISFNPSGTLAYVVNNGGNNNLTVIDTATNTVVYTLNVSSGPLSVDFSPSGTFAYVASQNDDNVSVISSSANITVSLPTVSISPPSNNIITAGQYETFTATISNGTAPFTYNFLVFNIISGSVITSGLYRAVASNSYTATLQIPLSAAGIHAQANVIVTDSNGIMSASSNSPYIGIVNTINASGTRGIAFNPSGTLAYVTSSNNVSVINTATNTVVNAINAGNNPYGVAFNPSGTLAYVTNSGSDNVSVINTAKNATLNTINVGVTPEGIAINPSGTLAYVADYMGNNVSVIDVTTNTVINTISVGTNPTSIAFNPSGTLAYVTNDGSDNVSVINTATNTVVNTINVIPAPLGIALNPSGTLAYLVTGDTSVFVINTATNTVVNTIALEFGSTAVAFNPSGTLAYITNYNFHSSSGAVSIVNTATNTVVNTLSVNYNPQGVALNPSGSYGYISGGAINMSVISTAPYIIINANVTPSTTTSTTTITYCTGICGSGGSGVSGTTAPTTSTTTMASTTTIISTTTVPVQVNQTVNVTGKNTTAKACANNGSHVNFNYQSLSALFTVTPTASGDSCFTIKAINETNNSVATSIIISGNSTSEDITGNNPFSLLVSGSKNIISIYGGRIVSCLISGFDNTLNPNGVINTETCHLPSSHPTSTEVVNVTISNSTGKLCSSVSRNFTVNYRDAGYSFSVTPTNSTCFSLIATNVTKTSPKSPPGYRTLSVLNVSVNSTASVSTINVTMNYSCSLSPSALSPLIFNNGAWQNVTPFSVNSTSCTVSFTIPSDPTVGLFVISGRAFASNYGGYAVSVINMSTDTVINNVNTSMGGSPYGLAVNPTNTLLYVVNVCGNDPNCSPTSPGTVSVVNLTTYAVAKSITVGSYPYDIALQGNSYAYVTNSNNDSVSVINLATDTVTQTIPVGTQPFGIAINPSGTLLYVANYYGNGAVDGSSSGTVSVISTSTDSVIATISVGYGPNEVEFAPNGAYAYVANEGTSSSGYSSDTVSVINVATESVTATIPVVDYAFGVAFNPSGTLAYVTGGATQGQISVISATTNTVTNTINSGGYGPRKVAFDSSGTLAYVTNNCGNSASCSTNGTVTVIDVANSTVIGTIPAGQIPVGIAIAGSSETSTGPQCYPLTLLSSPSGSGLVSAVPSNSVGCSAGSYTAGTVINMTEVPLVSNTFSSWSGTAYNGLGTQKTHSIILNVPIGGEPYYATNISLGGSFYATGVYVANLGSDNISELGVVAGNYVLENINVGGPQNFVTYSPADLYAIIDSYSVWSNGLPRIISGQTSYTVSPTLSAFSAVYNSGNGYEYFIDSRGNVSLVKGSVGSTLHTAFNPEGFAAYDSADGYVYVPNYDFGSVSIIGSQTPPSLPAKYSTSVDTHPYFALYDPSNRYVYVLDSNGNVSVLNGMTVSTPTLATIPVGLSPTYATYNPQNGYVYVSNEGSDTVSVINGTVLVATINVGTDPTSATYDPQNGYVYVSDSGSNTVSMISGNSLIGTVNVGSNPEFSAYGGNGYVYVPNKGSGTVSVINSSSSDFAKFTMPSSPVTETANYQSSNVTTTTTLTTTIPTSPAPLSCFPIDGVPYCMTDSGSYYWKNGWVSFGSTVPGTAAGYPFSCLNSTGVVGPGPCVTSDGTYIYDNGWTNGQYVGVPPPGISESGSPLSCFKGISGAVSDACATSSGVYYDSYNSGIGWYFDAVSPPGTAAGSPLSCALYIIDVNSRAPVCVTASGTYFLLSSGSWYKYPALPGTAVGSPLSCFTQTNLAEGYPACVTTSGIYYFNSEAWVSEGAAPPGTAAGSPLSCIMGSTYPYCVTPTGLYYWNSGWISEGSAPSGA